VPNMWQGGEKTQPAVDEGLDNRPIEGFSSTSENNGKGWKTS